MGLERLVIKSEKMVCSFISDGNSAFYESDTFKFATFKQQLVEIGFPIKLIPYKKNIRYAGKSHSSVYILYDYIMLGITQHSKVPLRIMTVFGFLISFLSLITALIFLLLKIIFWDTFNAGGAPFLVSIFFFGSLQAFFIGVLGEYVSSIHTRVRKVPLVVESKRVNF